jgi:anti-sigma-K factor RskA
MNEERYILFDQYLQGELTVDERSNLEKQLTEDPELASAFESFKEMHFQLDNKFGMETEREAFEENLNRISDKYFQKKKTKVVSLKPLCSDCFSSTINIIQILKIIIIQKVLILLKEEFLKKL